MTDEDENTSYGIIVAAERTILKFLRDREAKAAALGAGALGASISGAGPTTFALVGDLACARAVAVAMEGAFAAQAIESRVRVCEVDRVGARVEVDT